LNAFKVYLAGPIAGLTFDEGQGWRTRAAADLGRDGIHCYSPLRGKKGYLAEAGVLGNGAYPSPLATDAAVMGRDFFDCRRADCLLVHLAGARTASLGTAMELAWAFQWHKPVIATWDDGGAHDHPMVRQAVTHRAQTLEEAVALVRAVLLP